MPGGIALPEPSGDIGSVKVAQLKQRPLFRAG
jgi:hypothetical protein